MKRLDEKTNSETVDKVGKLIKKLELLIIQDGVTDSKLKSIQVTLDKLDANMDNPDFRVFELQSIILYASNDKDNSLAFIGIAISLNSDIKDYSKFGALLAELQVEATSKTKKDMKAFYIKLLLVVIIGFVVSSGLYINSLRSDNLQLKSTNGAQKQDVEDYRNESEKLREEIEKLREEIIELGFSPKNLLKLTNSEREKEGLRPLALNILLNESARLKAQDMKENNYWAHNSPNGVEPWVFFDRVGYNYSSAGENLANGYSAPYNAEVMVAGWMNSPVHREVILSNRYREVGFSTILDPDLSTSNVAVRRGQLTVAHYGSR